MSEAKTALANLLATAERGLDRAGKQIAALKAELAAVKQQLQIVQLSLRNLHNSRVVVRAELAAAREQAEGLARAHQEIEDRDHSRRAGTYGPQPHWSQAAIIAHKALAAIEEESETLAALDTMKKERDRLKIIVDDTGLCKTANALARLVDERDKARALHKASHTLGAVDIKRREDGMSSCTTCTHYEKDSEEPPCKTCGDDPTAYEPKGKAGDAIRTRRKRTDAIVAAAEEWGESKDWKQERSALYDLSEALALLKE